MTSVPPVILGVLAGLVLGWVAWLLSGYFVARYRAEAIVTPEGSSGLGPADAGAIPAAGLAIATTMTLWGAFVGWRAPGLAAAASALVVTALLLTITLVDFQVRRIPNPLVLALLAWAVIQVLWLGRPAAPQALLGLAVGGGVFLLLALIGRGALGLGDVKLEAAVGALVGYPLIWTAMLLGMLAGGLAALFLLLTRRAGRKDPIAYGPYLALGAWLALGRLLGLW